MTESGAGVDLMALYLNQISGRPLLDREDEARLGRIIQEGAEATRRLEAGGDLDAGERRRLDGLVAAGEQARAQFVEANLRLVVSVAKRYRRPGIELLDLVQAGNLGLLRAVERFDWRLGNKLSTYAVWWIRQAIVRDLANAGRTIRLPAHQQDQALAVLRAQDRLRSELGREASIEEVAARAGVDAARAGRLLSMAEAPLSLSAAVGEEDEGELGQLLADERAADPAQGAVGQEERTQVRRLLDRLSDQQAAVLRLRFGFGDHRPRSLVETAKALGVTREQVRRLEAKALGSLRTSRAALELRQVS